MESNVIEAAFTVSVVSPDLPKKAAVMIVAPEETDVASPVLSMVATDLFTESQATCVVRSCLLLSEKIPVAVNC